MILLKTKHHLKYLGEYQQLYLGEYQQSYLSQITESVKVTHLS